MCGIAAFVGRRPALPVVLDGLARLEYRGYDSAGVAVINPLGQLTVVRAAGKLDALREAIAAHDDIEGTAAIGHTRWATHGDPTERNAHPLTSADGRLAIVHNGIIENARQLRSELESGGVEFASDTDSEVVAHLLAAEFTAPQRPVPAAALRAVCDRLSGSFAIVVAHADFPNQLAAVRHGSPLVVGVGTDEMFIASDVTAFLGATRSAIEPGEDHVVTVTATGYSETDRDGRPVTGRRFHVDWDTAAAERGGYPTFMEKEIAEQPAALADTIRDNRDGLGVALDGIGDINAIVVVACGSAHHAGLIAKVAIEQWARIPVRVEVASEFRYHDPLFTDGTLVVAISQSGETMDTLQAVRHARRHGAHVLAICNTFGAQIPRESDAVIYTHAGPEIGVAATKSFLSQVTASFLLGLGLARRRGSLSAERFAWLTDELTDMPRRTQAIVQQADRIRSIAADLARGPAVLFIGRQVNFPVALEGALKLKELAYMHAEGFAAGELKHGPIALIEPGLPVVAIVPSPSAMPTLHSKIMSNIREVQARGARVVVLAEEGDEAAASFADHHIALPGTPALLQPLVATVPLQIMAAEVARLRGHDIDRPRNLAKSVTVE